MISEIIICKSTQTEVQDLTQARSMIFYTSLRATSPPSKKVASSTLEKSIKAIQQML